MARTERVRWRRALGCLLDLAYPPRCEACGIGLSRGRCLCPACYGALPRLKEPFCQRCGEPFEGRIDEPFDCPNCSSLSFSFEFVRPATVWDEMTRELIHKLKYRRAIYLAGELGRLATEGLEDPRFTEARAGGWPLVPVPVHRQRMLHRHFNQAAEIARRVATHTGLPMVAALKRIRATDSQTRLKRKDRLKNLTGAFALSPAGRRWLTRSTAGVIVVDDVLTTGSTAEACAATLRAAGCKRVQVLTVMRG